MPNEKRSIPLDSMVRVDFTPLETDRISVLVGTLVKRPQDVGDTFGILLDDGRVIEINPNCSRFESICELNISQDSPTENPEV